MSLIRPKKRNQTFGTFPILDRKFEESQIAKQIWIRTKMALQAAVSVSIVFGNRCDIQMHSVLSHC